MDNLKQLAKTIEETLTSKHGFKRIHGIGLFGGKAKKSFAVWSNAIKKGVFPLCLIRHYVYQDDDDNNTYYGIYAFSTKGEIETEALARLKQAASGVELGTVRYECLSYTRLQLWRSEGEAFAQKNNTIAEALSDVPKGLFVYAEYIGNGSKTILEKPLVIYANFEGGDYIYPIKKTILSKYETNHEKELHVTRL